MKLLRSLDDLPAELRSGAVSVGNFDGVSAPGAISQLNFGNGSLGRDGFLFRPYLQDPRDFGYNAYASATGVGNRAAGIGTGVGNKFAGLGAYYYGQGAGLGMFASGRQLPTEMSEPAPELTVIPTRSRCGARM